MKENKIIIEITANGWLTDVIINGVTYTQRYVAERGKSKCVEGDFESEGCIPAALLESLEDFFCFDVQQTLLNIENEEED